MSGISIVMVVFSMLGALDYILGNKFGLGKEFERGIMMMGIMMMTMTGMIILAPGIAGVLEPLAQGIGKTPLDPSVLPAFLLANDMGGASLSLEMGQSREVGLYNGLIVSSMMGCTISFTIPFALGTVEKRQHRGVLIGLMCGIITIPVGCAVSGVICGLSLGTLLWNVLPLALFSGILALGLLKIPDLCVKAFTIFGRGISILIICGLALGILRFLTGVELIKGLAPLEEGAFVCLNASAVMTGAFPLVHVLSKLLRRPLKRLGQLLAINETSVMGIFSALATSAATFGTMKDMDEKGVVLCSAFSVSGAFVFAGHLAFTMAFDGSYVGSMIVGKLVAGVLALVVACLMFGRMDEN